MSDIKPPAQPQRTQSTEEMIHARSCPSLTPGNEESCTCGLKQRIWLRTEQEMHAAWRKRAKEAEAYAQSLKQAAAPPEPVADPSKEELKAECEMLREELCYHRDYWAEWNMRALTAQAQKEELKAALGQARDYVVGLSAYLATCATATIIENLETTITSLHKERDYLERLLSGDGKE